MKNTLLLFGLLVLACIAPTDSAAQNITFKHLSTDDGLSQISVNSIYVDEQGLVWIATRDGLNCYNGSSIQTYKLEKDNPHSLFSNSVLRITGDGNGHLYLLCMDGVARFDMDSQHFTTLLHGKVGCMYLHKQLYIACNNEIFVYNENTGNFDSYYRMTGTTGSLSCLFRDSKGIFWLGTESDGLYSLSPGGALKHMVERTHISRIYEDSENNIWIGTWDNGLFKYDKNGYKVNMKHDPANPHSLSSDFVRCFCEDNQGNLWIGTMNGLNQYNKKTHRFVNFKHDNSPHSLSHSSVWCIQKDSQGTLWLGTYFGGVNYFNPEYEIYTVYHQSDKEKEGLSSPIVGNMLEDKEGKLWICTEGGGVNVFDPKTEQFKWYIHSADANSISHNNIKAIYYDAGHDIMWLGTHLGGLNRLDIRSGRFTHYKKEEGDPGTLPSDIVRDILPYKDSLIIATQNGVCLFSPESGKCRQLFKNDKLSGLIRMVADLEFDSQGVLWLAVSGEGVFSYDFTEKKLHQYKYKEGHPDGISNNNINSIMSDCHGKLWFCTSGSGLDCYDPIKQQFTNYDIDNCGLASNCIYKACETEGHELLLITNQGFSRFNHETGKIQNYNAENGFPLTAVNENALYIAKNKTVFLGGVRGMITFSLDKLSVDAKPYNIYWTKLLVNGTAIKINDETGILSQSLRTTPQITLNANQSMFSLYFSTSNYVPENKEELEYFLEGFSKKWTGTQGQPVITYTNLNPGTYTLRLRSSNKNSLSHEIAMKIEVLPPFYRTVWAYLFYTLLLAMVIYYLMHTYRTRVKLQESLKYEKRHLQDIEKLNQSKLRFFTSISHEFRTPLTLIVGQLEGVLQLPQVPPAIYTKILTAYKNSIQLKNLISELLDFRKQEQGMMKLRVQESNIVHFLNETYLLFVTYANTKQIHLEFRKSGEEIKLWFDAKQLQKVINNLLSNAIKHCKAESRIILSVYQEHEFIYFSVEDNGVGIPAKEIDKIFDRFYQGSTETEVNAGTGIGLALTKGIVELHHGTIHVESIEGESTKFTVKLPVGNTLYTQEEIVNSSVEQQVINLPTSKSNTLIEENTEIEIPPTNAKDGSRPSILIVEDNEAIRGMLAELFEPMYDVETAADGMEALEKIGTQVPQIVLSDVLMPRMSGIELTKQIKSNLDTCHVPVVLLTARTEVEHNLEGLLTGADDYITKPFDSRILISRCNNLINSRIQLQEYFSKQPAAQTPVLATNPLDKEFLDEVMGIFEKHMDDSEFTIDGLAQEMFISRTRIYAKIKAITGQTPNDFFITLRLKKAAHLLKNHPELNITSVSDQTGFSSPRYFSKLFKKAYQVTPMEYRKKEDTKEAAE